MRSGDRGAAWAARSRWWGLWWTVPLGLATVSAVVFVSVVLPALASGPGVPAQLVVSPAPSSAAPAVSAPARPSPTRTTTPPPIRTRPTEHPTPSATVVAPEQPVVRESDDSHEDRSGSGLGESNDR